MDRVPVQCPRCGYYPVAEVDICWACADGVADAERTRRLVEAALAEVDGAARILGQVQDERATPVLLETLATDVSGRARRAIVSAIGFSGRNSPAAADALMRELWSTDIEVADQAVEALADSTIDSVSDSLAAVMAGRPLLQLRAAMVLGWRRDQRALPVLERDLMTAIAGVHNLNRAAGPMLGRLGRPGHDALVRLLKNALAEFRDAPRAWSGPDRLVRELVDGLIGRHGSPDPEGLAMARQTVSGSGWALERLDHALAVLKKRQDIDAPAPRSRNTDDRIVPRWSMRLRRVDVAQPGPTTRFGGEPYFPADPVWPLHPVRQLPLTFLCQIAIPATVVGDGTWLAHVFITNADDDFVADPDSPYPVPAAAVIVHPSGRWWGPVTRQAVGPTYAYEWPVKWPALDPRLDRFKANPQFGFIISEVDLVPGADPANWRHDGGSETTSDDWNKVGGTPVTLQGGEEELVSAGWKFVASWDASWVGREMGDAAECYVWVHPDGRGMLDVQSH